MMRRAAPAVIVLVVSVTVAMTTLDRRLKYYRQVCFASQTGSWGSTIRAARRYLSAGGDYTAGICRKVNRALYEKGLLGREMFHHPQASLGGLLLGRDLVAPSKMDTLLQIGAIDAAERLATKSLKQWGPRPLVLRLLVKIALVKGDLRAAETYLHALSRDIVHGQYARDLLADIQQGETFSDDEEILQIRPRILASDTLFGPADRGGVLEALVSRNPDNRMAFEYLMAHYLLMGKLGELAEHVGHVRTFVTESADGKKYMPPHYAEALTLLHAMVPEAPPVAQDLDRDANTVERCLRFEALWREHRGDLDALGAAVAREMPWSYFGYYFTALKMTPVGP